MPINIRRAHINSAPFYKAWGWISDSLASYRKEALWDGSPVTQINPLDSGGVIDQY